MKNCKNCGTPTLSPLGLCCINCHATKTINDLQSFDFSSLQGLNEEILFKTQFIK